MASGSIMLNSSAISFSEGNVRICAANAGSRDSSSKTARNASTTCIGRESGWFCWNLATFRRTYLASNICAASQRAKSLRACCIRKLSCWSLYGYSSFTGAENSRNKEGIGLCGTLSNAKLCSDSVTFSTLLTASPSIINGITLPCGS